MGPTDYHTLPPIHEHDHLDMQCPCAECREARIREAMQRTYQAERTYRRHELAGRASSRAWEG